MARNNEFLIRRFMTTDFEQVMKLHHLALGSVDADEGEGEWDDDLKDITNVYIRENGEFLVGTIGGKTVAMGALMMIDAVTAEIRRMRVHPDYQRRGYGQEILERLEDKANDLGYKKLCLDTTELQLAARALYEKNGYRKIGEKKSGKFNLILYEKYI